MADQTFATRGDLQTLRDDFEKYKKECEDDRKSKTASIETLVSDMKLLTEKTDKQTTLLIAMGDQITAVLKQVGGFFANPRLRTAGLAAIVAILTYITYRLTPQPVPPPTFQTPVIVIPQHTDGGVPIISVQ